MAKIDVLAVRERAPLARVRIAKDVASVEHKAVLKRCLVLMPYDSTHERFYGRVVDAIDRAGFLPHRIDRDELAGNIPALFESALDSCRAFVVDLTDFNPNVMYELGQLRARGLRHVLVRRLRTGSDEQLPFYVQMEKLTQALDDERGWE